MAGKTLGVAESEPTLDALTVTGATALNGSVALGDSAADTIGYYGKAPVAQRGYSSAVHATSALASSTDFGATQLAAVQEIQKTLIGLGVWATV